MILDSYLRNIELRRIELSSIELTSRIGFTNE